MQPSMQPETSEVQSFRPLLAQAAARFQKDRDRRMGGRPRHADSSSDRRQNPVLVTSKHGNIFNCVGQAT